jgi:hypothetical protein
MLGNVFKHDKKVLLKRYGIQGQGLLSKTLGKQNILKPNNFELFKQKCLL